MQKGFLVVLIAAGIVAAAVVVGAIAMTTQGSGAQNNDNYSGPAITTDTGTGRNLTIDLNENLGLKSNT